MPPRVLILFLVLCSYVSPILFFRKKVLLYMCTSRLWSLLEGCLCHWLSHISHLVCWHTLHHSIPFSPHDSHSVSIYKIIVCEFMLPVWLIFTFITHFTTILLSSTLSWYHKYHVGLIYESLMGQNTHWIHNLSFMNENPNPKSNVQFIAHNIM